MPDRVKVKRDGPRGWHWIAAESYDPARHEAVDDLPAPAPAGAEAQSPAPATDTTAGVRRRGRPRKEP